MFIFIYHNFTTCTCNMNLVEKIKKIIINNCKFPNVLINVVIEYNLYDPNKIWHLNNPIDSKIQRCSICHAWARQYVIHSPNAYHFACPHCDTFIYCIKATCDLHICKVSETCMFCDKQSCKHETMIDYYGSKVFCHDCKNSIKKLSLANRI